MYVVLSPNAISADNGAWDGAGTAGRGLHLPPGSIGGINVQAGGTTAVVISAVATGATATLTAAAWTEWQSKLAQMARGDYITING